MTEIHLCRNCTKIRFVAELKKLCKFFGGMRDISSSVELTPLVIPHSSKLLESFHHPSTSSQPLSGASQQWTRMYLQRALLPPIVDHRAKKIKLGQQRHETNASETAEEDTSAQEGTSGDRAVASVESVRTKPPVTTSFIS